jgi:membrane protein
MSRVPWLKTTFKAAFDGYARHRLPRLAAALAYYTLFSLAPLLVVALIIAEAVLRDNSASTQLFEHLGVAIGTSMADTIESLVTAAADSNGGGGVMATVIAALILFIGASGMFQQLQDALNTVWDIPIEDVRGVLRSLRRRLYGVISVCVIGALLSVFVIGASVVAVFANRWGLGIVVQVINPLVAFLGVSVVSALVFQWLPARRVPWRAAWAGGVLTTVMLVFGSVTLGLLFASANPGEQFGEFAGIIVLIVFIYYTAQIFLLGAELTAAHVRIHMESGDLK